MRNAAGSLIRWTARPTLRTAIPQFCISIAFENRGTVIVGLVYDPVRQECFKAVRAQRCNAERRTDSHFASGSNWTRRSCNRLSLRSPRLCRFLPELFQRVHDAMSGNPSRRFGRARSVLCRGRQIRWILGIEAQTLGYRRRRIDRRRSRRQAQRFFRHALQLWATKRLPPTSNFTRKWCGVASAVTRSHVD